MPQESSDVLIRLLSSLDAKGFKAAQEEAKKLGLELRRAGHDGTVALNKLEKKQKDLKTTFVENAMKIGMVWTSLKKMVSASIEQHQADVQLRLAIKNNTDEYSRQGRRSHPWLLPRVDGHYPFGHFAMSKRLDTGCIRAP